MPNLNSWIEAQLKRGYSRKQIKSALIRRGYSPKAVAEVDKIAGANKKAPSSLSTFIVIILGIIIFVGIGMYFYYNQPSATPEAPKVSQETVQTPDIFVPEPVPKPKILESVLICDAFPSVANEISCEDALIIAIKKYFGEVYNVSKDGAWLIGIKLGNETMIVKIDKYTGKIL